ncbi:tyrosine kinase receptor Cad96Ca-like [Ptychodera flava]|uniref:tyrosine kinase receptor Cad96Ca-like n=1 Tax=Ptychodera flava TaxID=63121 RepID=UPI00396A0788
MDEDIKFNQYTGELLIEAPTGSCIKIDEYTSDGNWTTHKFDPINGPCDTSVTLKIDGSALLRIYFCNDDYTECGEPLEYEFHTESKSKTEAIIGVAVTLAVLLVLLFSGIFLYMRNKKSKGKEESRGQIYANRTDSDRHDYMDLELPKDKFGKIKGAYADIHQTETEYMGLVFRNRNPEVCDEDNTTVYKPSADDGQIPHFSNNLKLGETIIDGIFTKLVTAELPLSSQRALAVTVKTLKKLDDTEGKRALWKEVEFMRTLPRNPNILSCLHEFTTFDPLRLVLEPCYHGNLKTYLQNLNKEETEMKALLLFSLDCANGMKFLEEIQCVHRHLAARVVMLDGQRTCKISELGFSTAVMDQVTYEKIVKRRLPIRWMALESIENCVYSSETDVWSYGVLLWEIFSFGVTPYRSMNITDVLSKLRAGHRLPIPERCSNDVYSIMEMCWQRDPSNRPTFDDMVQYFEMLLSDSTSV